MVKFSLNPNHVPIMQKGIGRLKWVYPPTSLIMLKNS